MNKELYAEKWSLPEWLELCKNQEFVEAFWADGFERCDIIAAYEFGL
jgi:hypothetical protein